MVAATAAVLIAGSFEVGSSYSFAPPELRSQHAQPGAGVPADLMVVVSEDGKTFHTAGCRFIHDKARLRTIPASQALREGYVPCVRCMKNYLTASLDAAEADDQAVAISQDQR
jgi:hypothetical protein